MKETLIYLSHLDHDDTKKQETEHMRLQRHKMGPDDFEFLTMIGNGAFGEIVRYNETAKELYHVRALFYDVEPSVVRHCCGNYQKDLDKHEKRGSQEVSNWKKVLAKGAHLLRWDWNNIANEGADLEAMVYRSMHLNLVQLTLLVPLVLWTCIPEPSTAFRHLKGASSMKASRTVLLDMHINDTLTLGADYYQTESEIASLLAKGKVPIGVGRNSKIRVNNKAFAEISKEFNIDQESSQSPDEKHLKRPPRGLQDLYNDCIENWNADRILRQRGREIFIKNAIIVDLQLSPFVSNQLSFVDRREKKCRDYLHELMECTDFDRLLEIINSLSNLISEDQKSADLVDSETARKSVTSFFASYDALYEEGTATTVCKALDELASLSIPVKIKNYVVVCNTFDEYEEDDIQAVYILSRVSIDKCYDVMTNDVIPVLVKLMPNSFYHLAIAAIDEANKDYTTDEEVSDGEGSSTGDENGSDGIGEDNDDSDDAGEDGDVGGDNLRNDSASDK
ncbi:hypothetical protein POM88_039717 [Heracleum sosnowskyi]|uniref:Uncharacterized protein n=1 Tax=Heracleum sosnowskyi TaxID=360622 RepID=A0AAD8M827_9APIA|nr:hypothetical protein POM88_039717 [Heracleum sosnowskyi]